MFNELLRVLKFIEFIKLLKFNKFIKFTELSLAPKHYLQTKFITGKPAFFVKDINVFTSNKEVMQWLAYSICARLFVSKITGNNSEHISMIFLKDILIIGKESYDYICVTLWSTVWIQECFEELFIIARSDQSQHVIKAPRPRGLDQKATDYVM